MKYSKKKYNYYSDDERMSYILGNKGAEAAEVAIKMADFTRRMRQE